EWLGRENLTKGVQLRMSDDGLIDVDLYIVVEYGISIYAVCNTIVETVKYKLESMTGATVRRININVEGIRV
ncbi:MAG: Asp23/Gls24 family envelope stress response protein, partial [Clostridia bacterium]